jgi:hypothetical protein
MVVTNRSCHHGHYKRPVVEVAKIVLNDGFGASIGNEEPIPGKNVEVESQFLCFHTNLGSRLKPSMFLYKRLGFFELFRAF